MSTHLLLLVTDDKPSLKSPDERQTQHVTEPVVKLKIKMALSPWLPLRPPFSPLSASSPGCSDPGLLAVPPAHSCPRAAASAPPSDWNPLPPNGWLGPLSLYLTLHSSIISSGRSSWTTPSKLGPSHTLWHSLFPHPFCFLTPHCITRHFQHLPILN